MDPEHLTGEDAQPLKARRVGSRGYISCHVGEVPRPPTHGEVENYSPRTALAAGQDAGEGPTLRIIQ